MIKVVIIGTGETSDIVAEILAENSDYKVCGYSVNRKYLRQSTYKNLPLVALEELEQYFPTEDYKVFVAISYEKLNTLREKIYLDLKKRKYTFINVISKKANISPSARVGENCLIMENVILQHQCLVGNNVFIWAGSNIGHQGIIGDHNFISMNCGIAGFSKINNNCFVGIGSVLADNIIVNQYCFLGMGSIVTHSIDEFSVVKPLATRTESYNSKQYCNLEDTLC